MLLDYDEIRHVHIETSTLCNARCPLCPRNLYGVNRSDIGYREHSMTLSEFKQIFDPDFINQLDEILCNGNFGDATMNVELIDILTWACQCNPDLRIKLTSNGGARDREFWQQLAAMSVYVIFSIDGLEDTNHLYRQDVVWNQLMRNVKTFIDAGGQAEWKMVRFAHNQHQISAMRSLAHDLGFVEFAVTDHGRDLGPAFDRRGNYLHGIGDYHGSHDYKIIELEWQQKKPGRTPAQIASYQPRRADQVKCGTQIDQSIYVNAVGEVFPCCFWGFATGDFSGRDDPQFAQIRELISEHNALEHGLKHAVQWFQSVDQRWYSDDWIGQCHECCGIHKNKPEVLHKNDERTVI